MDDKRGPEWIVGLIVKIKTSLGEEVEGEIFSFDNNTNCVVLVDILITFLKQVCKIFLNSCTASKTLHLKEKLQIAQNQFCERHTICWKSRKCRF